MSKKAGIFYITDEYIDHNKLNIRTQISEIIDDPKNFQLKEFNTEEEFYKLVYDSMNDKNVYVTAHNIFETKDNIYIGYFISYDEYIDHSKTDKEQEEHAKKTKFNILASQIISNNVISDMVIVKNKLKYTINNNNIKSTTEPDTITRCELIDIIEKIFIKDGIIINIDGTLDVYRYIHNHLEHLMINDPQYDQNYVYHEYEVYTHVLIVTVDVREKNGQINEKATLLCNKPVKGRVYVGLYRKPYYNEEISYINLTIERFNNILNIRKISASLTEGMSNSDKEYVNFDKLLQLENDKYKNHTALNINQISGECLNN